MVSLLPYWWYSGYRVCDGRWSVVQEKSEGMIPTDAEKNWKREIRGIILPLTCILVMWLTVISLDKQTKLNVFKCAPKIKIKQQARVNTDKGKPNPTELLFFFLFFCFFLVTTEKCRLGLKNGMQIPNPWLASTASQISSDPGISTPHYIVSKITFQLTEAWIVEMLL